jgi:Domain of unknown function (DUF6456)
MPTPKAPMRPERASGEPTPERRRRSSFGLIPAPATDSTPARAGVRVYRAVPTLERLAKRGVIEPRQLVAGQRLRDDFELGIVGAREAAAGSTGPTSWTYAEAMLAAVRRYEMAIAALGPTADFVQIVCLEPDRGDISLAAMARRLGQNRQAISGIIRLGLQKLADFYGLA